MNKANTLTKCRNNHIFFAILLTALTSAGLSSCADDYLHQYNGYYGETYDADEATVPLTLSVAPMVNANPGSRSDTTYFAATDAEKKIADFWIIEYNEYGTRVGLPRYYKILDLYNAENAGGTEEGGGSTDDPEQGPAARSDGAPTSEVIWTEENGDISTGNINLLVPRPGQGDYTCVVIANTHDPNLFNADNRAKFSTLKALRNCDIDVHNQHDLFYPVNNDPEYPERYLHMSGWTKITSDPDSWKVTVDLIRNVCKVHVQVKNFPDEKTLKFKYYQWRNVPFGKIFPHGDKADYHQKINRDWIQHSEPDRLDSLKAGIDFWIPCNVWVPEEEYRKDNDDSSVTARSEDGEEEMEEKPTHFDIVCIGAEGTEIGNEDLYEFTLYPSKSKKEQFRFEANHYYSMVVDVKDIPEEGEFFHPVEYTYLSESNCYMMRRDSQDIFMVPVYRINRFWGEESPYYDEDMMLDDDTEWVAEVIWQDTPLRILDFGLFGDKDIENARDKFEGKGWGEWDYDQPDDYGDGYAVKNGGFAFRTTGTGEGNVVIGLRKKFADENDLSAAELIKKHPVEKRVYLWSWHIWITEYNPDMASDSWGEHQQVQKVPNGEVQLYFKNLEVYKITSDFIKSLNLPEGYPTYDDWDVPEYDDDVYIMDRNLGARETGALRSAPSYENVGAPTDDEIRQRLPSFGMYYQYGRKDPFPFAVLKYQTVYDIKGQAIPAFNDPTPIHVPNNNVSGDEGDPNPTRRSRDDGTGELPENGRKDTPATMIFAHDGSFAEAVKHPYIFYGCDNVDDYWFSDAWEKVENPDDINPWCNPEWWGRGNKSLFDPCPPGWKLMDFEHFSILSGGGTNEYSSGNLYLKTGLKDLDDNILINPIYDWRVTGKFGRNIGFAIISHTDRDLYAWLPITGKRYHDTSGASIAEGFQDHAGHSGLWLDFECALKYFTNECQFKPNNESLAAGYPVRCIRDTE